MIIDDALVYAIRWYTIDNSFLKYELARSNIISRLVISKLDLHEEESTLNS